MWSQTKLNQVFLFVLAFCLTIFNMQFIRIIEAPVKFLLSTLLLGYTQYIIGEMWYLTFSLEE